MSKFKVGDRVRLNRAPRVWDVGTIKRVRPGREHYDVLPDSAPDWWVGASEDHRYGVYHDHRLELVEEPNPFKSGDRVRILTGFAKGQYGKVVTAYSHNGVSVILDGTCGESLYYAVDSVQYAPDQTFVLNRGDRIVNKVTGRKGHVVYGQDEDLWVVDYTYSEETGAKAAAVEEYEQHYPGTYEITKKGPF